MLKTPPFEQQIFDNLSKDFDIRRIVLKDAEVHGVDSLNIEVYWRDALGIRVVSNFNFAKANKPKADVEHIAGIMRSYMRKGLQ